MEERLRAQAGGDQYVLFRALVSRPCPYLTDAVPCCSRFLPARLSCGWLLGRADEVGVYALYNVPCVCRGMDLTSGFLIVLYSASLSDFFTVLFLFFDSSKRCDH